MMNFKCKILGLKKMSKMDLYHLYLKKSIKLDLYHLYLKKAIKMQWLTVLKNEAKIVSKLFTKKDKNITNKNKKELIQN